MYWDWIQQQQQHMLTDPNSVTQCNLLKHGPLPPMATHQDSTMHLGSLLLLLTVAASCCHCVAGAAEGNRTVQGCTIMPGGVLASCAPRGTSTFIDLANQGITAVLPGAFPADDVRLDSIHLGDNLITSDGLPRDAFANLVHVSQVSLDHNKLTLLPATLFATMSSLVRISLNNNDIATVRFYHLVWLRLRRPSADRPAYCTPCIHVCRWSQAPHYPQPCTFCT